MSDTSLASEKVHDITCARLGCSNTFPYVLNTGSKKKYCSSRCGRAASKGSPASLVPLSERQGYVYFIKFSDRIKIGFSTVPMARLSDLPYDEILLIVEGSKKDEKTYHKQFQKYRCTGEWYYEHPDIRTLIENLRGTGKNTMIQYSKDYALRANGDPFAKKPRDRVPSLGDGALEFLMESETLEEALFATADLFRVPVTNNIPWFEDQNPDKPVYHVGDYIGVIRELFLHHGWTPPGATVKEDSN